MKISRTVRLGTSAAAAVAMLAASALPATAAGTEAAKPAPPVASAGDLADDAVDTIDAAKLLEPYVQWVRPLPGASGHDYKYATSTVYWSVVGIKPVGRSDVDLRLYDDKAQTQLLGSSTYGAGSSDFIAVDSNHRPFGGYFPKVTTTSGTGTYRAELAHGVSVLTNDGETVAVSSSDVVLVRDTWLIAGEEYVFGVGGVPGAVLHLMGSNPDIPSTWVRSRATALAKTPVGGFQLFAYTPTRTDWYGVVVTLPGTAGDVTMVRAGGPE